MLEPGGGVFGPIEAPEKEIKIPSRGEVRVDWHVKTIASGEAIVRVKALGSEESDAMELRFPVLAHGMLKTESYTGMIKPGDERARISFRIPEARRSSDSKVEVRYSPTIAGAIVDALPYLSSYPHGCSEQTLNRFLPTVLVQKTLREMGLDLKAIQTKRTNLNPQELGDPAARERMEANQS